MPSLVAVRPFGIALGRLKWRADVPGQSWRSFHSREAGPRWKQGERKQGHCTRKQPWAYCTKKASACNQAAPSQNWWGNAAAGAHNKHTTNTLLFGFQFRQKMPLMKLLLPFWVLNNCFLQKLSGPWETYYWISKCKTLLLKGATSRAPG